jgi:hypothetical protein
MMPATAREPSGSELVFGLLRTLMIGYQLWGAESGLEVAELSASLHTSGGGIGTALRFLSGEGLVSVDERAGTVSLTASGARHLLGRPDT